MAAVDFLKRVGQEFTIESIVEFLKEIRKGFTGEAGEAVSKQLAKNVGGADLLDEQLFADGVAEAITPPAGTPALLTQDQYAAHLARAVGTIHEEKWDTYRLQCLSHDKDRKPDIKGTARNIATHAKMTDTVWGNHVIFHKLDRPVFPVSIDNAIADLRARIQTIDNTRMTWRDCFRWFSI